MLRSAAVFSLCVLLAAGCKKEPPPPPLPAPPPTVTQQPPPPPPAPFKVTAVELGRGITPANRVQTPTDVLSPKDTIYLSVTSEGMPARAVLGVRWTYGPKDVLVKEETATLTPPSEKPMATEFHVSKASGWPPGMYKVVLTVDGQPSQTKTFTVSKTAAGKKR
jgi:hypothetical protein